MFVLFLCFHKYSNLSYFHHIIITSLRFVSIIILKEVLGTAFTTIRSSLLPHILQLCWFLRLPSFLHHISIFQPWPVSITPSEAAFSTAFTFTVINLIHSHSWAECWLLLWVVQVFTSLAATRRQLSCFAEPQAMLTVLGRCLGLWTPSPTSCCQYYKGNKPKISSDSKPSAPVIKKIDERHVSLNPLSCFLVFL